MKKLALEKLGSEDIYGIRIEYHVILTNSRHRHSAAKLLKILMLMPGCHLTRCTPYSPKNEYYMIALFSDNL